MESKTELLLKVPLYAFETARRVGGAALHHIGRSGAIDSIVRQQSERMLDQIQHDRACVSITGKTKAARSEAAIEIAAVQRFAELHAPQSMVELDALDEALHEPAEPFAVKQLLQILHEEEFAHMHGLPPRRRDS